jgi:hypothetical protein
MHTLSARCGTTWGVKAAMNGSREWHAVHNLPNTYIARCSWGFRKMQDKGKQTRQTSDTDIQITCTEEASRKCKGNREPGTTVMWSLKEIPHNWYTTFVHTTNPTTHDIWQWSSRRLRAWELREDRQALSSGMRCSVTGRSLSKFQRRKALVPCRWKQSVPRKCNDVPKYTKSYPTTWQYPL